MRATAYSRGQLALHWIVVVLLTVQVAFAAGMRRAFPDGMEARSLTVTAPAALQMLTGVAIGLLMVERRLTRRHRRALPVGRRIALLARQ